MRGRGHSKLLIVICIVFAFLLSLILQPVDTPTGFVIVTETLDISGSFTGIQILNYSLAEIPTRISFTGKTTGSGLIWIEQEGNVFLIADFDNESFNDYCLESCDLDLKNGDFSVFIKVDSGTVNVQNIDYSVSRGGDIIDREKIIEEITKQPVEEEPEVVEEIIEPSSDVLEKQPELKASVPNVAISLSASSADVDSTITMTCTHNVKTIAKITTLYWMDNSSGSFSTIPASASDVDCNGSTCTQSNPRKGTGYTKKIMCEGAGSYGLRCDFIVGKSKYASAVSSLTCNTVNTAPTTPTGLSLNSTIYINQVLTAVGSGSTDADSDSLTYYYEFYNINDDSTLQAHSTTAKYTIASGDVHDTIRVRTKSYDGTAYSGEKEANITVSNSVPTHSTPLMNASSKDNLTTRDLTCYPQSGSDADSDSLTYKYDWYKNNVSQGINSQVLGSANTSDDEYWTCEVKPYDDKDYGSPLNSSQIKIMPPLPSDFTDTSDLQEIYVNENVTFNATWESNNPNANCKIKFKKIGSGEWGSYTNMIKEDSGNQYYKKMFNDTGGYKYKLKCGNQITVRVVDIFHEEIDEFAGMNIDRKNERAYELSTGKLSMFQNSKFFKNASGDFEDIDFTIDFCSGNFKRCITKGKFEVYFDKNASKGIMMKHNNTNVTFKMESIGYTINGTYSASESRSSEQGGLDNQGSYMYEGIFSNMTAVYTYLANSLEKEINISVQPKVEGTPRDDDYFTIAVNLTIPGMKLTLDTESQVVYIRKNDDIKYKIPRAYAIDSNDSFQNLNYTVSGTMLYMHLNYNWFNSAVYPIIIDPSIQLTDTEDAADIYVTDTERDAEIQMRWDISSIPLNKIIDDAKLCFYMYSFNGLQDSDATITRIDDQSWEESILAIPYSAQTETNLTSETWSSDIVGSWTCLNVTTQLKEDYANSNNYASIRIGDPDYVMDSYFRGYDSSTLLDFGRRLNTRQLRPREYSTSSERPYLNVSYSNLTVVPNLENVTLTSTGNNISSDNLTLTFDVSDPDGDAVFNTTDWRRNATSIAVVNMRLDSENSTGVTDYTTYANDASVSSATWTSSGHVGGGYSFDGVNDYLEIEHSTSLNITNNITVMAWVKTDNEGYVIVKDVGNSIVDYEVFDGWESNSISSNWSVVTNDATYSSVDVQASGCSSPYAGTYYLWMDVSTNNHYTTNVLKTNFSMENSSDITIAFYHKETGEETHQAGDHSGDTPCSAGVSGTCGDGVFFTCNGTYWYRLEALTITESNWALHELDVSADPDFCADVNSDFGLKIMQHDNYRCPSDGRGFDNLNITYKIGDVYPSTEVPFVLSTMNGGEFSIINSSTKYNITYSGDLNDGNWHLLTGTYTKGNLSLYVDGIYQGSNTGFTGLIPTTPGGVWIGRNYTTASSSGYFNGTIDDVRIFDRVLTAEQIKLFFENDTRTLYSGETIIGDNWTVSVTSTDTIAETTVSTSNHLIINSRVFCGDTITTSKTMDANITACSGTAITIGASNIVLDCNDYSIIGDSNGTDVEYGINIENYNNITIIDCDVHGFTKGVNATNVSIINITGGNYSDNGPDNNDLNDNDGFNIFLYTISNFTISNVIISNPTESINEIGGGGGGPEGSAYGIKIVNSNNGILNNITGNADAYDVGGGVYGIYVSNSSLINVTNSNIYGGSWTRGITYANSKNGFILNNNFSTSNYAIYIILNSTNNIIENNNATTVNSYGILISSSASNNITNNYVHASDSHAISLSGSSNNIISNNTVYSAVIYGIDLFSSSDNNIVSNNNVSSLDKAIFLSESSNNNITNNIVTIDDDHAIYLTGSSNNIISNNTVTAIDDHGVTITSSSSNNTIVNNVLSADKYAIRFASSSGNNSVRNNNLTATTSDVIKDSTGESYLNSLIYNNSFGEVNWFDKADLSIVENGTIGLGTAINISNNSIVIDSANYNDNDGSGLNQSANLTFYSVSVTGTSRPFRNSIACSSSVCSGFSNVSDTYYFNVSQFTNYSVGNNTVPTASSLALTSDNSNNKTTGNLTGSFSITDSDFDAMTNNETNWYNNSVEVTSLANLTYIASENTTKGENWIFSARVYDGYDWSDWVNSSTLTIANTPPTSPTLILNSTLETNLTSENLTVYISGSSDSDSDSITNITDWRVGEISINFLNMPFETNDSSTVKDYSTFGNNGTITGATWTSNGKVGGGYTLDGNDHINIPNTASILNYSRNDHSFFAWIKTSGPSETIFSKCTVSDDCSETGETLFQISLGNIRFDYMLDEFGGISGLIGTSNVSNNEWHHVGFVIIDRSNVTLYVDGIEEDSGVYGGSFVDSNADLKLGVAYGDGTYTNYFNGILDEVLISNKSLSAEQISAIYNAGVANHSIEQIVSQETTKDEVWSVQVTPNDELKDGSSTTSTSLIILNTAPTSVTLDNPDPGDLLFTNRSPEFNWTVSTDADSDPFNYTFQLSLSNDFSSLVIDTNVTTNSYTYTDELDFIIYYWRVTPYDNTESVSTTSSNFTVVRSLVINLVNSTVDFGTKSLGDEDNTTDDSPTPFTFINQGNYFADLKNLTVNQSIWESQALNTNYFKIKARNSTSINGTGSKISFANVEREIINVVHRLNYSSGNDNVSIDLLIEVPPYEAPTTGESKRTAGMNFYWEDST